MSTPKGLMDMYYSQPNLGGEHHKIKEKREVIEDGNEECDGLRGAKATM